MRKAPESGPDPVPSGVAVILFVVSPRSVVPRQADRLTFDPAPGVLQADFSAIGLSWVSSGNFLSETRPAIDYSLNSPMLVAEKPVTSSNESACGGTTDN